MDVPRVTLPQADLSVSRLGLGLASMMRLPTRRERHRLLDAAVSVGITHFDVARLYGLGAAEGELGRYLRMRGIRDDVTIATKFGIEASPRAALVRRAQAPARALLQRSNALRSAVRGNRQAFAAPRRYDAATARASLDRSLRELAVDHVDILFLHDPRADDAVERDQLLDFFGGAVAAGKVRAWGSSEDTTAAESVFGAGSPSLFQNRRDALVPASMAAPDLAFGLLDRALPSVQRWLHANPEIRQAISDAADMDCRDPDVIVTLLIATVLHRNPEASVVFASTLPARLKPALAAIDVSENGSVALFASTLDEHRLAILGEDE